MRYPQLFLGLLAVAAASACTDITYGELKRIAPTVSVLDPVVSVEEPVALRIENESLFSWTYRSCPSRFEVLTPDGWEDVGTPFVICTAEVTAIGAKETIEIQASLPVGALPGEYRAVVEFEMGGERIDRYSNAFEVQ